MSQARPRPIFWIAALLLSAAGPLAAQEGEDPTIDRIVAVVGSAAITKSQVDEELFARQGAGMLRLPDDPVLLAKLRRQIVDTLVAEELLYQEALRDTTIKVTAQEVSDAVDKVMRDSRRAIAADQDFQRELRAAGFQNVEEWRRHLFDQQRRTKMIQRFRENLQGAGMLEPKNASDRELRDYYNSNRTTLPGQPASVSMRQLIVAPKPAPEALSIALTQADSIIKELRAGADFAVAARRFSQDPGTRGNGGSLGWNRPDTYVREFADAMRVLPRGEISEPVVTQFGVHIIQVERTAPTEVLARHILIVPPMDSSRSQAARDEAIRLRTLVENGASFDSLQRVYHDPGEEKELRGVPLTALPPNYVAALSNLQPGQLSTAFEFPLEGRPGVSKWGFVRLVDRAEAGPPAYDLIKDRLRPMLGRLMAETSYIDGLKRKTFIDIRLQ